MTAVAGICVSSWNGVQLSEIARACPAHLVREASAGATLIIFLCYVAALSVFALLLMLTGRFDIGFLLCATSGVVCFAIMQSPKLRSPAARQLVGTAVVYFISSIAIDELMSENSRRVSEKFVDLRRDPDISWQLLCRRMRSHPGNSPAMNWILERNTMSQTVSAPSGDFDFLWEAGAFVIAS